MFESPNTLEPYLSQGEKILWQGRGHPKLFSAQSMGGFIFLGIFLFIALFVTAILDQIPIECTRDMQ